MDTEEKQFIDAHEGNVASVAFDASDSRLLRAGIDDKTLRLWDLHNGGELFSLRLPTQRAPPAPLWAFDFRCTPTGCWIAVPLTRGKLALYDFGKIYD